MSARWHHASQTKTERPVSSGRLRELAVEGTLKPGDLVRKEGTEAWVEARRLVGLFERRRRRHRRWYYTHWGKEFGPISGRRLRAMAVAGQIEPTDRVWHDGLDGWKRASRLVGLFPAGLPEHEHEALTAPAGEAPSRSRGRSYRGVAAVVALTGLAVAVGAGFRGGSLAPRPRPPAARVVAIAPAPRSVSVPAPVPAPAPTEPSTSTSPPPPTPVQAAGATDDALRPSPPERLLRDLPALANTPLLGRVEAVAAPLLRACARGDVSYRFTVVDSDAVEASSGADGAIHLSRGLFDLVANDVELAWVLGHEIAHVELRHGAGAPGPSAATDAEKEHEHEADAWTLRVLLEAGHSRFECLSFLRRYANYLERRAHASELSRGPLAGHWAAMPAPSSRLVRLGTTL